MTILEIYERVSLIIPLDERKFINNFNDTVRELETLYPDFVIKEKEEFVPITSVHDENQVLELYCPAIVDNILFNAGQEAGYQQEFIRKAELAYLTYWKKNAKGKRVKRARW